MKKHNLAALFTSVTCGVLACTSGVSQPLGVYAATQGKYISDVIVITPKDRQSALDNGYTVMDTPLAVFRSDTNKPTRANHGVDFRDCSSGTPLTYLAYKTSNSADDAITEMKFMAMNDGWDYATYNDYLSSLKNEAGRIASNLYPAIEGYRHFLNKGTKQAQFAKDVLNIFYFDENDGLDSDIVDINQETTSNNRIKIGDLLADPELIKDCDSKILNTIFLESNTKFLDIFLDSLSVANSRNDDGKNFVEQYQTIKDNAYSYIGEVAYDAVVKDFMPDIEQIRSNIEFYLASNHTAEDFKTLDEMDFYVATLSQKDYENRTDYANMWRNAASQVKLLKSIEYHGIDKENCETLYDLVMDEDAEYFHYYPLVACLTTGQKSTALIGLFQTLNNATLDEERYYERINSYRSNAEINGYMEEGISCFEGVDRLLYQEGNVAMTMDAKFGAAKGDESWKNLERKRFVQENIMLFVSVSIAGVSLIGLPILTKGLNALIIDIEAREAMAAGETIGSIGPPQELTMIALDEEEDPIIAAINSIETRVAGQSGTAASSNAISTSSKSCLTNPFTEYVASTAEKTSVLYNPAFLRVFLSGIIAVAIVAFLVTLVLWVIDFVKDKGERYGEYLDIPGILCHYQNVYDPDKNMAYKPDKEYVYYYGAKNPFTVKTEADYGSDKDGTKTLGENKRNVQDIFDWSINAGKERQWGCIYFTKDRRAGFPITTASLKIEENISSWKNTGMTSFNDSSNLTEYEYYLRFDRKYFSTSYIIDYYYQSYSEVIEKIHYKYLCYAHDTRARYSGSSTDKVSTVLGSAVSNVATWGIALIALVGGVGIGFGIFKLVQKRKNKKVSNEE